MKKNILAFIAASALLVFTASCSNNDITSNTGDSEKTITGGNKENTDSTTFVLASRPNEIGTRTSMDYNTGHFFWERNDRIYVKDDDDMFQMSSNAVVESKQAAFKFMLPGTYKAKNKYMVYYPGEEGINDQVTIKNGQFQKAPNDNSHFGSSGDCGMGYGVKNAKGQFDFRLDHKAAYLCFQPRISHDLVSTYITRIEVVSDNNIAGKYVLNPVTQKLEGSGNYNTIILKLGGNNGYIHGFQLKKNTPVPAFMVIYPGTHKLTVKYYVKDIQTKVDGVIIKKFKSSDYKENNYYDIGSDLDVQAYDSKLYMWDAKSDYWHGYESEQPALPDDKGYHTPKDFRDNRWHSMDNTSGITGGSQAMNTPTSNCPNVNEMLWYCINGDPHWDADKLWITLKHLYKGGVWILKREHIPGFSPKSFTGLKDKDHPEYGTETYDYCKHDASHQAQFLTGWSKNYYSKQNPPSKINGEIPAYYFFLPAFEGNDFSGSGKIRGGDGYGMGLEGMYWSSTSYSLSDGTYGAFQFGIKARRLGVYRSDRRWGLRCVEFQ